MAEKKTLTTTSGKIDGQALWRALSEKARGMKDSWNAPTGNAGGTQKQNRARPQQLRQMLERYLKDAFPQDSQPSKSRVSWSGDIDSTIHLKGSQKDIEVASKRILCQQPKKKQTN